MNKLKRIRKNERTRSYFITQWMIFQVMVVQAFSFVPFSLLDSSAWQSASSFSLVSCLGTPLVTDPPVLKCLGRSSKCMTTIIRAFLHSRDDVDTDMHQTTPPSDHSSSPLTTDRILLQAAADLTTSTSPLVGVTKSIGVDYGLVRTGLAVTVGYEPRPLAIVSNLNNTQLCQHIVQLAEREKAHQIIVGLPFHKNGTEAEQTMITREFASQLKCSVYAHFGPRMPLFLWDERYSSKEAAARIRAMNPRANLYKELDADAACIILEYFYQDSGRGAIKVELPEDNSIREVVLLAWDKKRQEDEQKLKELTEMRMSVRERRRAMLEQARMLDDETMNNDQDKKKRKKKKKKKR